MGISEPACASVSSARSRLPHAPPLPTLRAHHRAQGRARRRRLRVITLLAGGVCLVVGCLGSSLVGATSRRVFNAVLIVGSAGLLLAVLPTERRLVQAVCSVMLFVLLLGSLTQLGTVWLRPPRAACGKLRPLQCALERDRGMLPSLAASLVVISVWLACALRLGWLLARCPSGRHLLNSVWRAVGVSVLVFAVQSIAIWERRAAEATAKGVASNIAILAMLLVVVAISVLPRTRARLTGWLASRGAASLSASQIAQLLGAGSADETMRLSSELLRSVPFNNMRASDFLADAGPMDLRARTQPAHIGEIDAFVRLPSLRLPAMCQPAAVSLRQARSACAPVA